VNDVVQDGGSSWICIAAHSSAASTEPGVGASYATDWNLLSRGVQIVRKSSDQSVTNSTTLVNDTALAIPLGTNDFVEFTAYIIMTSAATQPDIKYTFTAPAGATIHWLSNFEEGSSITNNPIITVSGTTTSGNLTTANALDVIQVWGTIQTVGTGGSLQFQWAQNNTNATATVVKTNSYLKATRP
jgi:hypothetical protein